MKLAYRPDQADPRDKPFALLRESRPALTRGLLYPGDIVALTQTTPISDQGALGSCVANATCDAFELLTSSPVQLSRLDLYFKARLLDGSECLDDGTYVRSAFRVMGGPGVARESLWPYDVSKVFVRPPIEALQDGYDHRIKAFFRISTRGHARGDDVRAAIDMGCPVVFGVDVGQAFLEYAGGEDVVWSYPDRSVGGHAMVIVGYRRHADGTHSYLVRNSWGRSWGLRSRPGHCWFTERYVWEAADLWVPTQAWA